MRVAYSDDVFDELVSLSAFIATDNEDAAQAFLDACDATFRFLAENNLIGSVRDFEAPELSNVRMWRVKGFEKYLIFYVPTEHGIRLLHILHSATDYNRVFDNSGDFVD